MKQVAWVYCALAFLTMVPGLLYQYEHLQVPSYDGFMKEMAEGKIDLENQEHKLRFAKVMINHFIANFESQEFKNAVKLLAEHKE